jgi:hypothetical protein
MEGDWEPGGDLRRDDMIGVHRFLRVLGSQTIYVETFPSNHRPCHQGRE